MSLDNSVSEYFKTVSAGRIPDEIKFYVKRSSKHSFPVSGDSKNTYNAEDWAGVKTPKVEPNSFKNVKLNDVGMRYMMNRRVFSVELDNKYIVENVKYFECPKCNKILFPDETMRAIELKKISLSKK
jgi:hypothetical protein